MAGRKNGLGRGLDAFFPDRTSVVKEPARKTITKTVKTEKKIVMENMTGFKRAGAKMIITYHAIDVAKWLKEE